MFFPFSRLISPKLILLPAYVAVWWLVAILGMFIFGVCHSGGDLRQAAVPFRDHKTIIAAMALAVAVIAGCSNYLLCRRFRGTSWKNGMKEAMLVILFATLLAAYPVHAYNDFLRVSRWVRDCHEIDKTHKLESLTAKGEMKDAVRFMEQACERFDVAKRELQTRGKFVSLSRGACGYGFFYCSLHEAWMDLHAHLPFSVHQFLDMNLVQDTTYINHQAVNGIRDSDKWLPLGREMAASKNLILQSLGLFIIGERTRFCELVYKQSDAGNPVFHGFAALVPTGLDPNSQRATQRLKLRREALLVAGPLKEMLVDGNRNAGTRLACEMLGDGEPLGVIDESTLKWLRVAENVEEYDRIVSGHMGGRRSITVKRIEESIAAREYAKAVEWMEMACVIHQSNVRLIGSDAPVFNPVNDEFGDRNIMVLMASYGLPSLIPAAVRHFLDRETEYDTHYMQKHWDGKPKLRNPEVYKPFVIAMTQAKTPIIRVVGRWLLGDREGFITAVYERRDQRDGGFLLLNRFVEESIDPDKNRVAKRIERRKSSDANHQQSEEKISAYMDDLAFRSIVKQWAMGYFDGTDEDEFKQRRELVHKHMKTRFYHEERARGAYKGRVEEDLRKLKLQQ